MWCYSVTRITKIWIWIRITVSWGFQKKKTTRTGPPSEWNPQPSSAQLLACVMLPSHAYNKNDVSQEQLYITSRQFTSKQVVYVSQRFSLKNGSMELFRSSGNNFRTRRHRIDRPITQTSLIFSSRKCPTTAYMRSIDFSFHFKHLGASQFSKHERNAQYCLLPLQ